MAYHRGGSVHTESPRLFNGASRVQGVQGDFRSASANIDTVDRCRCTHVRLSSTAQLMPARFEWLLHWILMWENTVPTHECRVASTLLLQDAFTKIE